MKQRIPLFFKSLFWSYDFSRLDTEKDKRLIIINTINYGGWRHWLWIIKNYGRSQIREIIENVSLTEFRPGALKLISTLLSVNMLKYASRSAYIRR